MLKVDFEKAYDCIDWEFLQLVMKKMNFGEKWRKWICYCISSASLSILVNGVPTGQFSMKRGLRQGCPLSPLFNLAAEAFSVICHKAISEGLFEGVRVGQNNVMVSHLQFADDTMVFCNPSSLSIANLKRLLCCFEMASGLKINFSKSSIFAFGSTTERVQEWANLLCCRVGQLPTTYLGLPLGATTNNRIMWVPVIEKIQARIEGWKARYLSLGGRITLINSVLTSLPLFYMSLYKMPTGVKDAIEKILRRFLWGGSELRRKIHLVDWESVTCPKLHGGLGIMDIGIMNRGLLSKWLWRYTTRKQTVCKGLSARDRNPLQKNY